LSDRDPPRDGEEGPDVEGLDDERTLNPDEETLPGPIPGESARASGGTGPAGRDDETVHAEFDGDPSDEDEPEGATIVEPAAAEQTLAGDSRDRDDDTVHADFAATMGGSEAAPADEETMVGPGSDVEETAHEDSPSPSGDSHKLTEDEDTLVGDVSSQTPEADRATVAEPLGGADVSSGGRQSIPDEGETLLEPELTGAESRAASDTVSDQAAGTRRRGESATDPATRRGVSATARDAAVSGSTARGGRGAPRAGPMRLAEGEQLAGRYTLVKRLGKGGMGEVWQARHNLLQGFRAIKVIKASISKDKAFRARFLTEGQTMMSVKHPGVVEVTDLDETRDNRELFMVMEHLDGRTLYDAIRDNDDPLCNDVRSVVRIYKELADGIQRIHDERIVHKDLKSDNALLVRGEDGLEHPKVIDFGLAKRVEDGDQDVKEGAAGMDGGYEPDLRTTLSGTLAYMAPEQFLGKPSSYQSDIYAFGVMFQECFTKGEYPLPRGGLAHYLQLHAKGAVPAKLSDKRADLDPYLSDLSDRCMALEKEDRPESLTEVADAMQWWLDIPVRRKRRNRILGMVAAAVFLISTTIAALVFTKTTASLSTFRAMTARRTLNYAPDDRIYLNDESLAALRLSAGISGEPENPQVLVDGEVQIAEIVHDGDADTLNATADLSALADGPHEIEFVASPGAAPARMPIVVDRETPTIRRLEVEGDRDGFVGSESPVVRVTVSETTVASVNALIEGGSARKGELEDPYKAADVWVIEATSSGEGRLTKMEVEVVDLAGNRHTQAVEYTQDTHAPSPVVSDLRDDPDATGLLLPVRTGVGAKLTIRGSEAGRATLTAAGKAQEQDVAVAGAVEFELPPVPDDGYTAELVMEDRAGNVSTTSFVVRQRADIARLTGLDGKSREASVGGKDDVQLSLRRFYGLDVAAVGISVVRTHGPDGGRVSETPADVEVIVGTGTEFSVNLTIPAGALGEGTWNLTPTGQGAASPATFTLTIDPSRPVIHGVSVTTRGGASIAPDGWSQTRDLVVEVDASDLDLRSVSLANATGPTPAPGRGRRTYRFEVSFPSDDTFASVLKLEDAAGNSDERTIRFKVDATNPTVSLTSPRDAQMGLDNKRSVDFLAQTSEPDCTLHVSSEQGIRGGGVNAQAEAGRKTVKATVQMIQGAHEVEVWVTDPSGRSSAKTLVALTVENLETKLLATIAWPTGVTARMEKVDAGDVVIEGRIFPVSEGYVDHAEVTNGAYRAFLAATDGGHGDHCHADEPDGWDHAPSADTWNDPQWSAETLPVVNVAYWDAHAFSHWSGRRLPMEAEWVKAAAKKTGELDLLRYPIGNTWQDGLLVTTEMVTDAAFQGPRDATVGGDKSQNRCLHLGGNVSEWIDLDRVPDGEPDVAVRGGNWYLSKVAAAIETTAIRHDRSLRAATIGFRCAVDGHVVRAAGITGQKD